MTRRRTRHQLEIEVFGEPRSRLAERCACHAALARCWRLLERRHADPALDLGTAATACSVERSYLNRLLRQATGFTFHQLLIRWRVYRVALEVRDPDRKIIDAAYDAGFRSLRSLQRNFQRVFGMTAQQYGRMWSER
ncbi:MAG: helix-turn-helix transcriptional regulator [Thermoanaerobaculia bacterium]